MWSGYLFAAEIYYQNTFIDRMNGGSQTFESTMKYFTLADEYAPLYRKTDIQVQWAKMQRLTYSLMFTNEPKESVINDIFTNLDQAPAYLKTIILGRLFCYFAAVADYPNAVKCAKLCIEIGEKSNIMLLPTLSYGILARASISMKNHEQGVYLTRRYLQLCSENGIYEYFRMRKAYDQILEYAYDNNIEPDITKQMMEFAGYQTKKAYIKALGGFFVYSDKNGNSPIKMRTKKERELLAFLLNSGTEGATKEQICEALWSESESDNIKKLIGVNLAHIKKDLAALGIENPVINVEKHYRICRDEIEYDIDLLEEATAEFKNNRNAESAHKILALYKGDYLADFEALWATAKRIEYAEAYEEALKYCKKVE
jgi:DNA-binding winged helix-turn-helix (wHTH) protein